MLLLFNLWGRRVGRLMGLLALVLCSSTAFAQLTTLLNNAGPEKRFALVIGNSSYPAAPLTNPVNDMRAISAALRGAGFDVMSAENAGRIQLLRLVREFGEKLAVNGGVGLFYFAGHGLQIKGRNYLVPVDAQVSGEDEAAYDSMDADFVLQKMGEAKNRLNIIILDACRNNPFVKTRSAGGGGLAQMDAPVGSLVAYATAPGSVASDGSGANGLYTQHLVNALSQKGLRVEEVFKQVRANVRRDSQGKQIPWENTALEGEFFFFPPESVAGVQQVNPHAEPAPGPAVLEMGGTEQAAWEVARQGGSADAERFLQRYPKGRYAQAARDRIAALQAQQAPAPAYKPPPVVAAAPPPPPPAAVQMVSAPNAAPGGEKISLQTLSGMSTHRSAVAAEPSQASTAAVTSAVVAPGKTWNYAMTGMTGGNQSEQVYVTGIDGGWQKFSNGTEIHLDGRVRAVRFGSYLVKVVSDDSFLKLPAKAGQNGANTAQVIDAQGKPANARITWHTEAAGETVKLTATLDGVIFVMHYEAFFSQDQLLPVRYASEMKNRLAGGAPQTMTARLQ